jgi:hypothetical protein
MAGLLLVAGLTFSVGCEANVDTDDDGGKEAEVEIDVDD